jgi:iron complex outermembrane receptor protein
VVDVTSRNHLAVLSDAKTGVRYSAVNPVAGITYRLAPALNLYAAYGRGFETPTLNDLAYRSTNGSVPGLNLGLRPARSDNTEVGIKAGNDHVRVNLAAFYVKTENELAVLANSGGRSVFQNIAQTTRRGFELGLDSKLNRGFSARVAYTHIRAVTANSYATCAGLPCSPVTVDAGNHLPAVPMNSLFASVSWAYAPLGLTATLETQGRSKIYVDDRNTDSASGFWVENFRIGVEQLTPRWKFSEFVRVDNLSDRSYVGSVIVNEGNSRFFEPAPGRTFYVMFNVAHRN